MNNYIPYPTKLLSLKDLSEDTRLFKLDLKNFSFSPGQFLMVSVLGFGEAPFSISSSPTKKQYLELVIRKVGRLTQALFDQAEGDKIFIRGPYGNGFPLKKLQGKNVLVIAGGCGLAPLRSIIQYHLDKKNYFNHLQIFYGAKSPDDLLFKDEIKTWQKNAEMILTVDKSDHQWQGNSGQITNLLTAKTINSDNAVALVCGPPAMYDSVVKKLLALGFKDQNIYLSLERNMQCGLGLCQHCTCGEKYVCTDGPVFTLAELKEQFYKND